MERFGGSEKTAENRDVPRTGRRGFINAFYKYRNTPVRVKRFFSI
jgi:hypothetical protein